MKLTGLLCILSLGTLLAQENKLAPDLQQVGSDESVDVIIQMEDPPAAAGGRRGIQLPVPRALNTSKKVTRFGAFPGFTARVKGSALAELARESQIKYISPDREVASSTQFAIPAVGADLAQKGGLSGLGIGIAVIDSGVSFHRDLFDNTCK
ncbi:MAG: hypothetical protein NTX13_11820 [Acidobacteria bacterium]|nr:hypothetical protein [Acidobacteriota bacterium]